MFVTMRGCRVNGLVSELRHGRGTVRCRLGGQGCVGDFQRDEAGADRGGMAAQDEEFGVCPR